MLRCQSCGALNNVRSGQSGRAVCGRCKATLDATGAPQEVDGAALARLVGAATVPVLVDFWAPWCAPCRAASPVVDQFARERAGQLITLKVNTEQDAAAARTWGIRSIPTFVVFQKGQVAGRRSGAMSKEALTEWVARIASVTTA